MNKALETRKREGERGERRREERGKRGGGRGTGALDNPGYIHARAPAAFARLLYIQERMMVVFVPLTAKISHAFPNASIHRSTGNGNRKSEW